MFEEKLLEPHFTSVLAPYMLDVVEQKRALGNKYNAGVEALSAFDDFCNEQQLRINRSNAINFTAAHCSRAKNLVQCIHVTPCMAHSTVKSLIYSVDIDSEVLKQKLLCSFTAISGRG